MEVLHFSPGIAQPPAGNNIYPCDVVTKRLNCIPETPSTVQSVAAPPSPGTEIPDSCSTATNISTATNSIGEASSATTSVLSLPNLFTVQKFHVSPNMPMDEEIQSLWTEHIKSRLSAVLRCNISTGTCVQELLMAGKSQAKLKPTLIITCGDAVTKKKVVKTFRNQRWLQDSLKANDIMFIALVAKTPLSAGPVSDYHTAVKLEKAYAVQQLSSGVMTACGLKILIGEPEDGILQHCTLGGLVLVNGKVLGLTTGHAFSRIEDEVLHLKVLGNDEAIEEREDDDSSTISSEPFVFNDDDDEIEEMDNSSGSTVWYHNYVNDGSTSANAFHLTQDEIAAPHKSSVNYFSSQAAILPNRCEGNLPATEGPSIYQDWALLEELPHSIALLPNLVAHIDRRHDTPIEDTMSGSFSGEVTIILAGVGPQFGYLHSSPAAMQVNASLLDVKLITLECLLPLGSSGAWVVLGNKLCGYIVAIRQDVPWAYMIAIEPVLEDIRRKLGTDNVRLPKAGELQSLASSLKGSKMRLPGAYEAITTLDLELPIEGWEGSGLIEPGGASMLVRGFASEMPYSVDHTSRIIRELPSSETPLPQIGDNTLSEEKIHLLEGTQDRYSNEKVPYEASGSTLQGECFHEKLPDEASGSTLQSTDQSRPSPEYQIPIAPSSAPRAHDTNPISGPPYDEFEPLQENKYPATERFSHTWIAGASNVLIYLYGIMPSPYKLSVYFEKRMLRLEYKRRKRGHHIFYLYEFEEMPPYLFSITLFQTVPYSRYHQLAAQFVFQSVLRLWAYSVRLLVFIASVMMNIIYFLACFPAICWIGHRHRDVLGDARLRERQRLESIEMLGWLGLRDVELGEQYHFLHQRVDHGRPRETVDRCPLCSY